MSLRDTFARYAGFQAITSGVDSGRSPNVLDSSQLSWMVNMTARGGFPTCRPSWKRLLLTFLSIDSITDVIVEANFKERGRFQGAWPYLSDDGRPFHLASIGGRIFLVDPITRNVQDLSAQSGETNTPDAPRAWFVQAENYLIIQNATDGALIYDGNTLRRSGYGGTTNVAEVPPGSVMEYNNGRLWIASPEGDKFVAGDLVYSVSGTRADVLGFTENLYLNGGGFFVVPATAGTIVAMRSVAVQDSATGQGPMQVITTRGGFSVNAPFNRDDWQNTTSPIITISLLASGATAQASTTLVNGDIWFRAPDGIRSYVIAHRDHGTWVNTPLSREVSRTLDYDSPHLLEFSSSALFDNRYLCTTQPFQALVGGVMRGVAHKGLVPLDFAPVSQMFNRSQPVWEGVWTGLDILQILTTEATPTRAYLYTLNEDGEIEIWEMTRAGRFDDIDTRINWSFETPSYGFDTGGWNLRELGYGDFWVNRLAGRVNLNFSYRVDNDVTWNPWASAFFCAQLETCDSEACEVPLALVEQYRPRTRLPAPASTCDPVVNKPRNQGYRFAARVEGTGFASISQLRLVARDLPEDAEGACPPLNCELVPVTGCAPDDYTYTSSHLI